MVEEKNDKLAEFLEHSEPPRPSAEDLESLAEYVEANPGRSRTDLYKKAGLVIVIILALFALMSF